MQYRGYIVPSCDMQDAVDLFNGNEECWCRTARGCNHHCDDCLLCANYGNDRAKTRLFALLAIEQGYFINRSRLDVDDINRVLRGSAYICNTCGNVHTMLGGGIGDTCIECRTPVHTHDYQVCTMCGRVTTSVVTPDDNNEIHACSACASEHLYRCVRCGHYSSHPFYEQYGGRRLCDSCLALYRPCVMCGNPTTRTGSHGDAICNDCSSIDECVIHKYSFKPSPRFYGDTSGNAPYLGVELEAGDADGNAEGHVSAIHALAQRRFYLKHDGSVPEFGFEIVTHPCTFDYHASEFPWRNLLSELRQRGFRSYGASRPCGLHVHVNRNALNASQWLKIDWFISRSQSTWARIARRTPNHYCRTKRYRSDIPLVCQYGISCDRYQAVNFCNRNTVEFRLFRGSLKYETVIGTLAIVDGLVSWAKNVKMRAIIERGALDTFIEHLKSDARWEPAVRYLKERNLI